MDSLMNLCRSTRIVVVSSSHRGIFSMWALVGRGHGDSDRSLFFLFLFLSICLLVSPRSILTKWRYLRRYVDYIGRFRQAV